MIGNTGEQAAQALAAAGPQHRVVDLTRGLARSREMEPAATTTIADPMVASLLRQVAVMAMPKAEAESPMCGIAVIASDREPVDAGHVRRMCDLMAHRGPNSSGRHARPRSRSGMRRLSIIDLEGGDQPIYNEDRSLAIVFNGEIYNFRELREQLLATGHRFSTGSDTEVVLHLYEERREEALPALRGMFAFAIHERDTGRVFLARDRLGIKPLHYAHVDGRFFASSESSASPASPIFRATSTRRPSTSTSRCSTCPLPARSSVTSGRCRPATTWSRIPGSLPSSDATGS